VPLASYASRRSRDILNPLTPIPLTDLEGKVDLSHFDIASSGNVETFDAIAVTSFLVEVVDDVLDLVYSNLRQQPQLTRNQHQQEYHSPLCA
jgi:hypothetical protein